MLSSYISQLVQYGIDCGLTEECERIYATNLLLDCFHEREYDETDDGEEHFPEEDPGSRLERILAGLLAEGEARGLVGPGEADLFDTKLMNCLVPRPAQVRREFAARYAKSPEDATDYYFKFSQDTDYIRRYRVRKDQKWKVDSEYGEIDITINLSKPEKDPKAIAAARMIKSSSYPKCLLCAENEGYAGHLNHPARENHRLIPLTLGGEAFALQYSPYTYYNEHCIVLNTKHVPMKIDRGTFRKLLDFVEQFPHYFIGSNADLPIVGGSILSHDHYQGGRYTFAMAKAPIEEAFSIPGFEDVETGIVKWPLSVIRIRHLDKERLVEVAVHITDAWRKYTDGSVSIFAETDGEPHNTVTPIARKSGGLFEMDLALRNNLTTPEHPDGLFHPHAELHHIKKENIGLIEVMGLAVLPARLKSEMALVREAMLAGTDIAADERIAKHAEWADGIVKKYGQIGADEIGAILQKEIGHAFVRVLEDAGVFKRTPEGRAAFRTFIGTL